MAFTEHHQQPERKPSDRRAPGIVLPPMLHAALGELAEREGHSLAGLVALLVNEGLAQRLRRALWTTNYHMLNGARAVLEAWGFEPVTILTWVKNKMGAGCLAARPDRTLHLRHAREAGRPAHQRIHGAARAGASALAEA